MAYDAICTKDNRYTKDEKGNYKINIFDAYTYALCGDYISLK